MPSRNGTRQPQARKSASGSCEASPNAPVASSSPTGAPACTQLAVEPAPARVGPCSTTISTAPAHSPPTPSPCTNRSTTSSTGASDPGRLVGRQQPDQERREADEHEGGDERRLPADAVAVVAEHDAAERPGEEPDGVGGERGHRPGDRVDGREEQAVEDEGGGGAVQEEVVPLDGGADEAGGDDFRR